MLLAVILGPALPACCGLKSLTNENEGKHKVRATVNAALLSFERQLADASDETDGEDRALARALLER